MATHLVREKADNETIVRSFVRAYAAKGKNDISFIIPRIVIYMNIGAKTYNRLLEYNGKALEAISVPNAVDLYKVVQSGKHLHAPEAPEAPEAHTDAELEEMNAESDAWAISEAEQADEADEAAEAVKPAKLSKKEQLIADRQKHLQKKGNK